MQSVDLPYADATLEQALQSFRCEHNLNEKYRGMSEEAQAHFERHDMIHVLFGLDTSIQQEAQADGWTLLGTDVAWRELYEFSQLPEEKEIESELGAWTMAKAVLKALPDLAGMLWRARRLRKRWRWSDNAAYRQMRVSDIRAEFGIDAALS